jgi:hypothetical protein
MKTKYNFLIALKSDQKSPLEKITKLTSFTIKLQFQSKTRSCYFATYPRPHQSKNSQGLSHVLNSFIVSSVHKRKRLPSHLRNWSHASVTTAISCSLSWHNLRYFSTTNGGWKRLTTLVLKKKNDTQYRL